jgi:hypothetical protein
MRTFMFATAMIVTAAPAALAQHMNPGTGPSLVYQNPVAGCGYGWGLGPPSCGQAPASQANRIKPHHNQRAGNGAGAEH